MGKIKNYKEEKSKLWQLIYGFKGRYGESFFNDFLEDIAVHITRDLEIAEKVGKIDMRIVEKINIHDELVECLEDLKAHTVITEYNSHVFDKASALIKKIRKE